MRTLIVDDEPTARSRLTRLLANLPGVEIAGQASDGLSALRLVTTTQPDAIFLDVQMPSLSGFDVVAALPVNGRPAIVFVTAFDQYALQAFDVNAVDYLLKPVTADRVTEAVARLQARASQANLSRLTAALEQGKLERIVGKQRQQWHVLPIDTVEAFVADQELVFAVTARGRFLVNRTLRELEARLDTTRFIRVHKQALVNLRDLVISRDVDGTVARTPSGVSVPISRRYATPVLRALGW